MGRALSVAAVTAVLTVSVSIEPASAAAEPVDVELVLAVDVSGSMDRDEQVFQRNGYVEALRAPEVLDAIQSGLLGRIAITYLEWAGPGQQRHAVGWTVISDARTAEAFAAAVLAAPIGSMRGTSISSGLQSAALLFEANGYEGYRRVIDVSGDGPNNQGAPVVATRDQVLALGIVINGLPITMKQGRQSADAPPSLNAYYQNCVIGGPGSFVVPVAGKGELATAIRRKLVLEIADAGQGPDIFAEPVRDAGYRCGG